jgi:hypothetical protein
MAHWVEDAGKSGKIMDRPGIRYALECPGHRAAFRRPGLWTDHAEQGILGDPFVVSRAEDRAKVGEQASRASRALGLSPVDSAE